MARELNPNMRRVRAPAAEEARNKAERRRLILLIMSYDSLYHQGEYISASTVSIILGITLIQAAHCLGEMSKDLLLTTSKQKVKCRNGSHLSNVYSPKKKNMMSKAWRRHPNYHPMPSRWKLGAPI